MTNDQIFDVMREIIILVTGVPECILDNQNAPSPSGEYCAVQPKQSVTQRGQANIEYASAPGSIDMTQTIKSQMVAVCSINFYRGAALDYATLLAQANKRSDVSQILYRAGLGWLEVVSINNLTALQSEQWEPRAQISIRLGYEIEQTVTINTIERIPYSAENDDGDVLSTGDITTPDAP